ncbi:unnamed protein product [Caenorhabditis angaria]|uniref:Uncharacterized protein n=1 Tax=Caenorhabditis angaria TaxID=860376 RepID=A0A9P1I8A0_9PELO|nr:unnamed protein product [Caenorhabditis angaria]
MTSPEIIVTNIASDGLTAVSVTNPHRRFQIMDDELAAARGDSSGRPREFHSRSSALDTLRDIELDGKTFAITGTTSGIGIETARALALKGAHVIMFNRNIVMSENLKKKILEEKPDAKIDFISCDLNSLQSVKAAADEYLNKHWPLHGLILNAGVFGPTTKMTFDNFEAHFGINHVAHFLLCRELLPALRQSSPSRIVFVSSLSSSHTGIKSNLSTSEKVKKVMSSGFFRISLSTLCIFKNVQFHPGTMIGTDIARGYGVLGKFFNIISKPFTKSLAQGAATSVYCATHPDVAELSGKFWESCWDDEKSLDADVARDIALQDALWEHTEVLIDDWLKTQKPISTIVSEPIEEEQNSE